jgi:hypothetical protein
VVYRFLADATMALHLGFVAFVAAGGLLVLRWPRLAWLHLPCSGYGALIEFFRWTCPLTPLENQLRRLGGQAGYGGGFIERYLVPIIYPEPFPFWLSAALGTAVLLVNGAVYAALLARVRRHRAGGPGPGSPLGA